MTLAVWFVKKLKILSKNKAAEIYVMSSTLFQVKLLSALTKYQI